MNIAIYIKSRGYCPFTAIKLKENGDDLSGPTHAEVDLQIQGSKEYNTGVTRQVLSKSRYLKLELELQNSRKSYHSQERKESSPMTFIRLSVPLTTHHLI